MKTVLFVVTLLLCATSYARDDVQSYPIQEALNSKVATQKLGDEVKFYFGDQKYGDVSKRFGEFKTNKKTNAFNKSDEEACRWVFISALIALKNRAIREGADAVVNIRSNYKNNLRSSTSEYRCGSGAIMAGVALTGDLVKLK